MTTYTLDVSTEPIKDTNTREFLIHEIFNHLTSHGLLYSFVDRRDISFHSIRTLVRSRSAKLRIDVEKNRKILEHLESILYKIAIRMSVKRGLE